MRLQPSRSSIAVIPAWTFSFTFRIESASTKVIFGHADTQTLDRLFSISVK